MGSEDWRFFSSCFTITSVRYSRCSLRGPSKRIQLLRFASHGVDLFFVLSGFLIGGTQAATSKSSLMNRFRRRMPLPLSHRTWPFRIMCIASWR
jgi:peptidoglycan/LPS O-acetylase OafA/YrhL